MRSVIAASAMTLMTLPTTPGCVFDASVDNGAAQITCRSDDECPPSWTCAGLCVAPVDVLPPRIVDVSFDPAVARANVPVRLTIVADEELGADPSLTFSGDVNGGTSATPPLPDTPGNGSGAPDIADDDSEALARNGFFALLERAGARAVYERVFTPADGIDFQGDEPVDLRITLESVTLQDVEGNTGAAAAGASLFVDRSAPLLTRISAQAERFSAVPPFDQVEATVELGEHLVPPASLAVFLGDEPLVCGGVAGASPGGGDSGSDGVGPGALPPEPVVCFIPIDESTPEGQVVLQAVASDAAGNISVVGTTIVVDHTPPVAVGVTSVTIEGEGAAAVLPTMVAGATVTLEVTASEPLAQADIAGVLSTAEQDLSEVAFGFTTEIEAEAPERVRATYRVEAQLPVAAYRADAVLVDDVGNASPVLSLVLATPLVVAEGAPSPCVATLGGAGDEPPAGVCTDFDHDGAPGASPVCAAALATDCHDDDPFIRPGAFDIAGDFSDNACNGSQGVPLDETSAVFVSATGSDDAPGTRAAPKRSVRGAVAALGDVVGRRVVALQAGAYVDEAAAPIQVPGTTPFVLIGGLDDGWQHGGGESILTKQCGPSESDGAAIIASAAAYAVDVTIDAGDCPRSFDTQAVFLRRAVLRGTCDAEVDGCYVGGVVPVVVWRSHLDGVRVFASTLAVLDSTIVNSSLFGDDVDIVRSRVSGVASFGGGRARIISSVVVGTLSFIDSVETYHATLSSARILASPDTTAYFDNSLVVMTEVIWGAEPSGSLVTVRGSDLFAPCVTPTCVGTVEGCTFPGCNISALSFNAAPLLDVDGIHVTPASPLLDAGAGNSINLGAPTSTAGDIDGECRLNALAPDIGADES